ncbi:MAG: PspA/IM30 family protein [Pseudomonadota bacterium]|nr:PspA/IM30 family protein [Pseudomonadota bacterium]
MWKAFMTLMRGEANDRAESVIDANGITILRQQIRELSAGLSRARAAEALTRNEHRREVARRDAILARIADLEARALAAIEKGEEGLSLEAAEAIAGLEADRDAAAKTIAVLEGELSRLARAIADAGRRIRELGRGLQLADAMGKTASLRRDTVTGAHHATLGEAEATLARLLRGAEDARAIADNLDMDDDRDPADRLSDKLAEKGCGPARRTSAESVLERLKARSSTAGAA